MAWRAHFQVRAFETTTSRPRIGLEGARVGRTGLDTNGSWRAAAGEAITSSRHVSANLAAMRRSFAAIARPPRAWRGETPFDRDEGAWSVCGDSAFASALRSSRVLACSGSTASCGVCVGIIQTWPQKSHRRILVLHSPDTWASSSELAASQRGQWSRLESVRSGATVMPRPMLNRHGQRAVGISECVVAYTR
jgi:hypothetical protein